MKKHFSEIKKMFPQPISDIQLKRIADAVLYVRDNMIENCSPHQTCFYVSYMGWRLINRQDYNISLVNFKIRTVAEGINNVPCIGLHTKIDPEDWHCVIVRVEKDNTPPSETIDFNIGAICRAYVEQGGIWNRELLPEWIRLKKSEDDKHGIWYTTYPLELVNARQKELEACIPIAIELTERAKSILKSY